MDIAIRLATARDLDAIEALYGDLGDAVCNIKEGPRWSRGVYPLRDKAEAALTLGELYVAELDGEIAGSIILGHTQGEVYRPVNWQIPFGSPVIVIGVLAVHPNYFGKGIGTALLRHAETVGRQTGIQALRLDCFEENLPAEKLYLKCGFQIRGKVDLGLEETYGLKWYKVFEKLL